MAKVTIVVGSLLVVLGIVGYAGLLGGGSGHVTALIPAFAGAARSNQAAAAAQTPTPARTGGDDVVKTVRRDEPKVGRNDPCPCGSGKKYKKCHGQAA